MLLVLPLRPLRPLRCAAVSGRAQMTGAPGAPATSASRAWPSSAMPAPLREIGFDQNLDQRVPLDTPFRDEAGRDGPRSATTSARGRSCWCSSTTTARCSARRCSTAWRARSACCRSTRARTSRSSRSASIRATRRRSAAAKKADYLERYKRPGAADGWHFLTGDRAVDRAADEGRRLPLRLGRADASSSRIRPASSC